LTVILLGSRLERREDGRFRVGAIGGRDGGQPGMGSARDSAQGAPIGWMIRTDDGYTHGQTAGGRCCRRLPRPSSIYKKSSN